eukprot:30430-Pelagomonas_calceolata.AAC.1
MLSQNIKQAKPKIMWLILESLAQAPAEILFSHLFWLAKEGEKDTMLAHSQPLHPILKSPTSPIFKTLSNLMHTRHLDMPTPKQATTHII